MSKIPLARKFFFQEPKTEPEREIVYCGNHTAKTFHTDLHLIERVKRSCQVQVVHFVSRRSMVCLSVGSVSKFIPSWEYNMYFQNCYKLITIHFTKTVRNKPFLALKHFIFSTYKRASVHAYHRGKPQLKIKNMNADVSFPTAFVCLKVNSHFHWVKKCLDHFKWGRMLCSSLAPIFQPSNADRVARLFESWLKVELALFQSQIFSRESSHYIRI